MLEISSKILFLNTIALKNFSRTCKKIYHFLLLYKKTCNVENRNRRKKIRKSTTKNNKQIFIKQNPKKV